MNVISLSEKEKDDLTWEALADIDAGRVISQEKVSAWIQSLDTENEISIMDILT